MVAAVALRRVEPGPDRRPLLPLLALADEATDQVEAALDEGWLYVLTEDGVDVGAVQVVPHDRWSAELRLVAVDPVHHGRGLGQRMVKGVLEELASLGWHRVVVGTSNAGVGQIAFYQKCGFRLLRIDRDYFDEARGYDGTATENGIVHRDLVWFDQILDPPTEEAASATELLDDWSATMRRAADEFGRPIFGLAGPLAEEGVLNGHGGVPCEQVTLLYRSGGARIEVTTGRKPLGGTDRMVTDLLFRSSSSPPSLPWTLTLSERLVTIPVAGTTTQFRVMESSTGQWLAAGGLGKRHLLIHGTTGVSVDDLALTPVSIDLDG
jgi:ribosomal protein S18 acetylase RimI-like enzyme